MPEWLGPVLIALIATLPGLYAAWRQRQKVDAERTEKIAGAAVGLLDDFREENRIWRERALECEVERTVLHETLMSFVGRNRVLEAEVERLQLLLQARGIDDAEQLGGRTGD